MEPTQALPHAARVDGNCCRLAAVLWGPWRRAVRYYRDASPCGERGAANVRGLPPMRAGPMASAVALVLGALKLRSGRRPEEDAQVGLAESLGMFPQRDPDRIHLICAPEADRHPISRLVLSEDVG
jgi:hypothetical protein